MTGSISSRNAGRSLEGFAVGSAERARECHASGVGFARVSGSDETPLAPAGGTAVLPSSFMVDSQENVYSVTEAAARMANSGSAVDCDRWSGTMG